MPNWLWLSAGVKVCCLWPERVKVSAHRRLKAGLLAVWDSSSCLGHRGGSSRLRAAWQWLTALNFRPVPLKRASLCAAHPTALTVYRPRQRSHLAFFLLTHNVVFGSASPCSLQQPDTWTCVISIRFTETQWAKEWLHAFILFTCEIRQCIKNHCWIKRGNIDPVKGKPMSWWNCGGWPTFIAVQET